MNIPDLGRMLVGLGLILVLIGLVLTWAGKFSWIGRLPGDIYVEGENYTLYFPLATCVLLSVVLSVVLYLVRLFTG